MSIPQKGIEGSNPSVSAIQVFNFLIQKTNSGHRRLCPNPCPTPVSRYARRLGNATPAALNTTGCPGRRRTPGDDALDSGRVREPAHGRLPTHIIDLLRDGPFGVGRIRRPCQSAPGGSLDEGRPVLMREKSDILV